MPVKKMNPNQTQLESENPRQTLEGLMVAGVVCLVVFLGLGVPSHAFAQVPVVSAGSVSGAPGTAVDLPVNLTAGATAVSTIQLDLALPTGVSFVSVNTGGAATAAGKSASASAIPGGIRLLVFGLNQNAIASGTLATLHLSIASGLASGSKTVAISGIVAADPAGDNVTTTGLSGTVVVSGATTTKLPAPTNLRVKE